MFEPLHDPPTPATSDRVFLIRQGQVLVREVEDSGARSLHLGEATDLLGEFTPEVVIGRLGATTYWVSAIPAATTTMPDGLHLDGLRALHGHLDDTEWNIAGRATQLWDWHNDNQFCGRCGEPMRLSPGERAMRCDSDGFLAYPRISPAVIVLVERDDGRALLGRSGRWDTPMYSTLAGFVEAGETLEETVHREIREEVGVALTDVRYFGSQPWPFPNSLMLGFTAQWADGEIDIDNDEIIDAQWFEPDDLPEIPPKLSIARQLIDAWIGRANAR